MPKKNVIEFPAQPAEEKKPGKARYTKRKDGLYQRFFRYEDPATGKKKPKTVYGKTQAEADEAKRIFLDDVRARLRVDKAKTTVSQWIDVFMAAYKPTVGAGSYRNKETDMQAIREAIGDKRLREVTPLDIQNLVNTRAGLSTSHIKKLKFAAAQLFEAAEDNSYIKESPVKKKLALPRGTEGEGRELTQEEKDLINNNWMGHHYGKVARLILYAGTRPGEAFAMKKTGDANFETKEITIDEAVSFDGNAPILGDPKTEAGKRIVPMVLPAEEALRAACEESKDPVFLFPKETGGMMTKSGAKRSWESFKYYLERKLNGDMWRRWAPEGYVWKKITFRLYDLRHTYCTMLYDAGVDLKTAMLWMGHSDAQTTMNVYTKLSKQRRQKSQDAYVAYIRDYFERTASKSDSETLQDSVLSLENTVK